MKPPKAVTMWAIYGVHGWYTDTATLRKDMISKHTSALGESWKYCVAKGDRCVKVILKSKP